MAELREAVCVECGRTFGARSSRRILCSQRCNDRRWKRRWDPGPGNREQARVTFEGWMTTEEASTALGVHRMTVHRLGEAGVLRRLLRWNLVFYVAEDVTGLRDAGYSGEAGFPSQEFWRARRERGLPALPEMGGAR